MKAIIPVAGAGTQLRPHTYSQPKALIPVGGKAILSVIIEQLKQAGIDEFVFVVGYLGEKIKAFISENYPKLKAHFVQQDERKGIGHAIWLTQDLFDKKEEVIIVLGDTIFELDVKSLLGTTHSALGVKKVDDPRAFGVAVFDDDGKITSLVEKPVIPRSNMALVGIYKISNVVKLIEAIEYNIKNNIQTQNEFQLTDGLQRMIEQGHVFEGFEVLNWFDCGRKDTLLATNAILLRKNQQADSEKPPFNNTIVVEPVSIAKGVEINNSIIGPNVVIGESTKVEHSIIQNSIIGSYAEISQASLKDSVIGSDTSVKDAAQSLNIGDNTEIDFS